MILELKATSKLNQGYVPKWIRIQSYDKTTKRTYELTMYIMGETIYEPKTLQTYTKGWLEPRIYQKDDGPIELEYTPGNYTAQYCQLFDELIQKADLIIVGIYPVNDINDSTEDVLTNGIGCYTNTDGLFIKFEFECKLDL